uniref:Neurotransmitter-gated ion-channel ligand-binding domain-containing protein n=1 Tax=Panagrolaimus davidi TaxID=227884 RepID=A0A914PH33_9BILA
MALIKIRVILLLFVIFVGFAESWIDQDRQIENAIFKKYNRKHRPVKSEATTMQIEVFLMINHIEKVDEKEQTLLLHGQISASWFDEYLVWDPSKYNNTNMIAIDSWKIWQPSFALYNSARSNGWYLHMQGVPATVISNGKVYSSGSFSFYVTCVFDFSDYPYDVQECPIVIADWVYDLSKVNLSDPVPTQLTKPIVRLSFDPDPLGTNEPKKHVAGWEVQDTWRKHCYWGSKGCVEGDIPTGPLDTYWSLLEFGIQLKRHAPYYGLTILLPALTTSIITLIVFWIDDYTMAISITMLNLLFQGFCSWSLMKQLPPANGKLPRIGQYFGYTLVLTAFSYGIHTMFHFLIVNVPGDIEFPFQLTNITEKLREIKFFKVEGLSFDPQSVLLGEYIGKKEATESAQENHNSNNSTTNETTVTNEETLVDFNTTPTSSTIDLTEEDSFKSENVFKIEEGNSQETEIEEVPKKAPTISNQSHLAEELYTIRRIIFAIYLVIFITLVFLLLY